MAGSSEASGRFTEMGQTTPAEAAKRNLAASVSITRSSTCYGPAMRTRRTSARRSLHSRARAWLAAGLLVLAGATLACREPEPVPYLRLSGPAPLLPVTTTPTRGTLVAFWASWCPPCVRELPSLLALAERPPGDLSVVLLVQEPSTEELARLAGRPLPETLRVHLDPSGHLAERFRIDTLPATILVSDGQLVARWGGDVAWDARPMRALLGRLLEERRDAAR